MAAVRFRNLLKNVALALGALIVAGVLLEATSWGLLRARGRGLYVRSEVKHPYDPALGWGMRPNADYPWQRCGGTMEGSIKTGADGHAITPYYAYPTPALKIAVVGGSTMFGVGESTEAHNVPSCLEKLINERSGIEAEVVNLAVDGFQSFQEMVALRQYLIENDADIVLSISGRNDAWYAASEPNARSAFLPDEAYHKTRFVRSVEAEELNSLWVGLELLTRRLRSRSYTAELIHDITNPHDTHFRFEMQLEGLPHSMDNVEQRARESNSNYAIMAQTAEAHGARFVAFLQPTAYTKASLGTHDGGCVEMIEPKDFMQFYADYERVFYQRLLDQDRAFEFHDLTGCLDTLDDDAYVDACHYTDAGAYRLAEAVYTLLEPILAHPDATRR